MTVKQRIYNQVFNPYHGKQGIYRNDGITVPVYNSLIILPVCVPNSAVKDYALI
jgi:hypothetical protein